VQAGPAIAALHAQRGYFQCRADPVPMAAQTSFEGHGIRVRSSGMSGARTNPLRKLPSVERVLRAGPGALAISRFGQRLATNAVRRVIKDLRPALVAGGMVAPEATTIAAEALALLERGDVPSARRVFNLTGTVLHTNLGRAVLPEAAVEAAITTMRDPVVLEYDLATGERGERDDVVRGLIRELTGAEDAVIVNNNAAAVLIALNTLSAGKETIVSRGELIEIGGSFRLPDIMARAGVKLVEVGTTNRTHLQDYATAIGERTGVLMRVHTSNYVIQGFTATVGIHDLAGLARTHGVPLIYDLGSGTLVDLGVYGLRPEPTVPAALLAGADLVTFSGDKLLGGPQCGVIAGRRNLVEQIARNPLKRVLRLDKVRLAMLAATLKLYRDPDQLPETLPTLRHFLRDAAEIKAQATRLAPAVRAATGPEFDVCVIDFSSEIGSGALPLQTLTSAGIAIRPVARGRAGLALKTLGAAFRRLPIPVIGHLSEGALVLDCRCLDDEPGFLAVLPHLAIGTAAEATASEGRDAP
jgi:L-seryl-tRNA(Ser) seleniumtransferase